MSAYNKRPGRMSIQGGAGMCANLLAWLVFPNLLGNVFPNKNEKAPGASTLGAFSREWNGQDDSILVQTYMYASMVCMIAIWWCMLR